MTIFNWKAVTTILFAACLGAKAEPRSNPLPPLLNSGIMRFNGEYYAMDARTNGQMVVTENLIDWQVPTDILGKEPETGSFELVYRNGTVILYRDGKGYAAASAPLGPYTDFVRSGISGSEMRLFQDDGGSLFSLHHRLGSKKEGEIWIQPYSSAWQTRGKPTMMLDGRRGVWDSVDSADLGDPEMIAYRGNYYLLYGANSPSPRTGRREIGVAVAKNPTKISAQDKRPESVLRRNYSRLERNYKVLLPTAERIGWDCRYSIKPPTAGWQMPNYSTAGWRSDEGGFGYPLQDHGAQIIAARTEWETNEIWIRREFELKQSAPKKLLLKIRHETAAMVFLNGTRIYQAKEPARSYIYVDVSEKVKGILGEENLLAVYAGGGLDKTGFRFIDVGLFDAGDEPIEASVCAFSQPRMVTGPNGFEKWLSYRAFWDGVPGTGLDRLYFMDEELYIDGPTTTNSPGYHPPPAQPTFVDHFTDEILSNRWEWVGGEWKPFEGTLMQAKTDGSAYALLKQSPAENYLFEANIQFPNNGTGRIGVVAYSDDKHRLLVLIDPAKGTWCYKVEPGNQLSEKTFRLPDAFSISEQPPQMKRNANAFHRLQITKNAGYFDVELDAFKLTANKPIITQLTGPGRPGLCTTESAALFDGITYTIGWDEHDHYITGWGASKSGIPSTGEWRLTREDGLEQKKHSEKGLAFKGDLLDCYEFLTNVRTERLSDDKGEMYGIYPVFIDMENYLRAVIVPEHRTLLITGKKGGKEMTPLKVPLARAIELQHLYDTETAYDEMVSWIYRLRSESIITGIDLRWLQGKYEHLRENYTVPSNDLHLQYAYIPPHLDVIFWEDSRFFNADEPRPALQKADILNPVRIRPAKGNYLSVGAYDIDSIVVDKQTGEYIRPDDGTPLRANEMVVDDIDTSIDPARPDEAWVHVELESSYFFRSVKLADRVIIELNGQPMIEVKGKWPPSQVGLFSQGQPCIFNGITLMHLPEAP